MKSFLTRRIVSACAACGIISLSPQAFASAFQLWEQDGASVGNYHAGYAAAAQDASTAFYNPAGIPLIKNQQLVVGGVAIATDFKYEGTVGINSIMNGEPQPVTGQGGVFVFAPNLHYVAPLTDQIGFGLSIVVPFGLKSDYGSSTILRYAATETSVTVIDISPSLGFQLTDKFSFGFGLDIQHMYTEFDLVGVISSPVTDTLSSTKIDGTGYGFHTGILYQFTPDARLGLSYHSQVVFHLEGDSKFQGMLADLNNPLPNSELVSHATSDMRLPAYTALSYFQRVNPQWAIMASAIYTQWNVFEDVVINNVAGVDSNLENSTTIQAMIPQHYRNTWNLSIGANYYPTDQIIIRGGVGYDETPVKDEYRNVQLPDNNRYVIALGGHYQATKTLGFDIGWEHFYVKPAKVNPPPQVVGAEIVYTDGEVHGGADVYSAQVTWDIT